MSAEQTNIESVHIPVLLQSAITHLDLSNGDVVFDGTFGAGGYSREILSHIIPGGRVIATDQDSQATDRFRQHPIAGITLHHANFSQLWDIDRGPYNAMVLDLGISSDQLSHTTRGISFQNPDAELDMRMDTEQDLTAWGILQTWSEQEIADILFQYSQERHSRPIARAIVQRRSEGKLETVGDLVAAITSVLHRGSGPIHPATKTFQALRIAVNQELHHLEQFLMHVPDMIAPSGRIVIVSFHSLEERIVKKYFREWKQAGLGKIVTRTPVVPTDSEIRANRRSRSGKLRSFRFT